ncbi:MAG: hypothetical protein HY722_12850 [Planctomycetes bacterium]|nr:hypothetical protein [Planctomycetota bacterium]
MAHATAMTHARGTGRKVSWRRPSRTVRAAVLVLSTLRRAATWHALAALSLAGAALYGALWVRGRVEGMEDYRVRFLDLPAGLPATCGEALLAEVSALPAGASTLDPTLVGRVAGLCRALPWVRELRGVRRVLPDRLVCDLVPRLPVAAVDSGDLWSLADADGVRLPSRQFPRAVPGEDPDVPWIHGLPHGTPPPDDGLAWARRDVLAGLSVAAALREHGAQRLCPIRAIDVSNVGGRLDPTASEIILRAGQDVVLEWGRSAIEAGPGELTPAAKLKNLAWVLARFPGLEGVARVRLQFPVPGVIPR